jgi:CheY-like chemotaxis protein
MLLIEDNPGDVRLVRESFAEAGIRCTIDVLKDGAEALGHIRHVAELPENDWPDLVLLDINLPNQSGHEILATIKRHPKLRTVPVIMFSTSSSDDDLRKCYELQANSYIVKPLDFDQACRIAHGIGEFWFKHVTLPRSNQVSTGAVHFN